MQNHVRAERPGAHPVIYLTRIDGSRLVVNAELIETVEHTADTVINLVDGKRLIVAETVSSRDGIGYLTMNAREFLQTDVVVLGILMYAALGKLADLAAKGLEHWWLRWHPAYAPGAAA